MSERDPWVIIGEMLTSITAIDGYLQDIDLQTFSTQMILQDAVIRRFEILGEAASQLPAEFRVNFPEIDWRAVTTMRNRLIHGYFIVNLQIVWETAHQDLPPLKQQLQTLLDTHSAALGQDVSTSPDTPDTKDNADTPDSEEQNGEN